MPPGFAANSASAQEVWGVYRSYLNFNSLPATSIASAAYVDAHSFISLIGGVKVRVIAASVTVTCHDGTRYGDSYRLATTLTDHRAWPA